MVDNDVLIAKVNSIQNYLKRIHDTVGGNPSTIDEIDIQDIVVLNLQRAIQLAIDIASHIISDEKLGIPQNLKDFFRILHDNKMLSLELKEKMEKMVGFRNIAVHDYQAINPKILKSIISHHLQDLENYYSEILICKKIKNPSSINHKNQD